MRKMKKILCLLLSLMIILPVMQLSVFAEDDVLEYLTYEIKNGEVTITDCDTSISGDIIIPDTIDGYPVTVIGELAFYRCNSLKSVTIPDSITRIDSRAFLDCLALEIITVSENNQHFSSDEYGVLFNKDKTELQVYPIGNGRTAYTIPVSVTTICDYSFAKCKNLHNITISENVTTIGLKAFICARLKNISVSENNQYFSNDEYGVLFNKDKTKLQVYPIGNSRTEYTIPASVKTIGESAFEECGTLRRLTIENGVTTIGSGAFYLCRNLEAVTLPNSLITIGDYAFSNCEYLKSIIIPDSVITIGKSAFQDCDYLKSIIIPDSVITIEHSAFYLCRRLEEVTIGKNVKTIGGNAFDACPCLESIAVSENNQYFSNDEFGVLFNKDKTELKLYPKGSSRTEYAIPDSVTIIEYAAFRNCDSLENIIISENVINIEDSAFYDCDSLKNITIPESVTNIDFNSFGSNGSLEKIIILNSECKIYYADNTISRKAIICGYPDSTAQAYAEKYDRTFIPLCRHEYNAVVTAPTCTEQGYTTYTCACGDSYVADYVDATGHKDTDGDNKCDSCEFVFKTDKDDETDKDNGTDKDEENEYKCYCSCHSTNSFISFFQKIIRFLRSLFGLNFCRQCKCPYV